ncbi:MAG: hypothetical protein K8R65_08615, partial [Nitrospirae bacterium]|nr:hypothetical protein [Nitrospirota bacterium]
RAHPRVRLRPSLATALLDELFEPLANSSSDGLDMWVIGSPETDDISPQPATFLRRGLGYNRSIAEFLLD